MRDRRRVTLFALLALVAALTLVAAGCGGGSDEASSDETTIETTETTTEDTETTEETTETTDEDTGLGSFANEDCLELASVGAKFSEALSTTSGNPDFETTTEFFQELVDKAPDEIKADLQTLSEAWVEVAAALKDVDLSSGQAPSAETLAKLQELGNKFNTPELQQASKNLTAWSKKNCGTS